MKMASFKSLSLILFFTKSNKSHVWLTSSFFVFLIDVMQIIQMVWDTFIKKLCQKVILKNG